MGIRKCFSINTYPRRYIVAHHATHAAAGARLAAPDTGEFLRSTLEV